MRRGETLLWKEGVLDREERSESWEPSIWARSRRSTGGLLDADDVPLVGVLWSEPESMGERDPSVCCGSFGAVVSVVCFGTASGVSAPGEPAFDPNCSFCQYHVLGPVSLG